MGLLGTSVPEQGHSRGSPELYTVRQGAHTAGSGRTAVTRDTHCITHTSHTRTQHSVWVILYIMVYRLTGKVQLNYQEFWS